MSQFALLIVTDEATILAACRNWVEPLPEPNLLKATNPFTGEPLEIKTWIPEKAYKNEGAASLEEVQQQLKHAQPLSVDIQLHSLLWRDVLDDSPPYLVGKDEQGPITIRRIPAHLEHKAVDHLPDILGVYADEDTRRQNNLAMYVLIYSY